LAQLPYFGEFRIERVNAIQRLARRTPHRLICPTEQISDFVHLLFVQPLVQKYSDFQKTQISSYPQPSRPLLEGRSRDRHGRWERDAMDAGGAN
jgi:hypothetical protein